MHYISEFISGLEETQALKGFCGVGSRDFEEVERQGGKKTYLTTQADNSLNFHSEDVIINSIHKPRVCPNLWPLAL